MQIRPAQVSDAPILMRLLYDTVHHVNCKDYSPEQINAWAPALTDPGCWQPQFPSQWTFVAEEGSKIVGFCELEQDGHIGCFYCHYQHQHQGVGSSLLQHLEMITLQQGCGLLVHRSERASYRLYTEASITARPFFEHWGFRVVQAQEVERHGVLLRNYMMEKGLSSR